VTGPLRLRLRLAAAALGLGCQAAWAHSPFPGVGNFYAGMLHPLIVPAHLIALLAFGLWWGQRWPTGGRGLLGLAVVLPMGMAVGLVFGPTLTGPQTETLVLAGGALGALAAAADRTPPAWAWPWAGAALGWALGLDSLPDGLSGRPLLLSLAGTWLAALLLPACLVVVSEAARQPWMKIALRVIASWLAAAAVLVLVLDLVLAWRGTAAAG
jgi:urease accessory protein